MPSIRAARSARRRLGPLTLAAIFVAASAVTALDYAFVAGAPALDARRDIHRGVFDGTAMDPDRYRVLAPLIVEGAIRVLGSPAPYDSTFDRLYAAFYVIAMTAMLWSMFSYVRVWFSDEQALIAVLLVASTLRITIRQHNYAPASYLEPTFVALALLLILNDRRILLAFLVTIATLNRETAVFIVFLFAVTHTWTRRNLAAAAGYAAIWLVVFLGVRLVMGPGERYWDLDRIWRTNLSQPGLTLYNLTAFLGVMWIFALLGLRHAPGFVRRTAWVIPAYLIVIGVWGIWWEVRLLMALLPVILTLSLSWLFEPASEPQLSALPRPAVG